MRVSCCCASRCRGSVIVFAGRIEHSGFFALIDGDGNIRSRKDAFENPIIYYDGLEEEGIEMLIDDIKLLLKETDGTN